MLYPTHTYRHRDPFALMRDAMRDFGHPLGSTVSRQVFPAVNVWQSDEAVAITAELPGVEASDIEIAVEGDVLTLSGERKEPELPEGAAWRRSERGYGKFSRAIRLPFAISEDKVEARFENGVLRIGAGRPDEDKPRRIEIKAA